MRQDEQRYDTQVQERGRQNSEGPANVELPQIGGAGFVLLFQQKPGDDETAEYKEDIHSKLTAIGDIDEEIPAWQPCGHAGQSDEVKRNYQDNREGAKAVESGEAANGSGVLR